MNKNINEEKMVRCFAEIAEFELPVQTVQSDLAALRTLLEERAGENPGVSRGEKRIIGRFTKFLSAAMIFIAVLLFTLFLPEQKLSAAELLVRVSETMKAIARIKTITQNYQPSRPDPVSVDVCYCDYINKQVFCVYDNKYIHRMDYDQMHWSVYRPDDNTMIVSELFGEWEDEDTQLTEYINTLNTEGLEVRQSEQFEDGVAIKIIEFDEILNNLMPEPGPFTSKMLIGDIPVKIIKTKLIIREDNLFLSRREISYYDSRDRLILTKKQISEPVEGVPADIYELGVPKDVKIINKVPQEQVKEIRRQINHHRTAFTKNYVAVQVEMSVQEDGTELLSSAKVIYSKGQKRRVDGFKRPFDTKQQIPAAISAAVKQSADQLVPYVSEVFVPSEVSIYDGLWRHALEYRNNQWSVREPLRSPEGDGNGSDDLEDFGWRSTPWWSQTPGWIYEDDFSRENQLLAVEMAVQSEFGRLPHRFVLYVDSSRDYLYRRYITQELLNAPWQTDPNWIDAVQDKYSLTEMESIYDVTEYAQTSQGQWYPKTIKVQYYSVPPRANGRKYYSNRIQRIYLLQENPDLPEELFDPDLLKKTVTEK